MEDLNQADSPVSDKKAKKPVLLKVLTILSLVYIGFQLLGKLMNLLIGRQSRKVIEEGMTQTMKLFGSFDQTAEGQEAIDQSINYQMYIQQNLYVHTFANIAVLALGLYGVILMMTGKKRGFHVYILYSLAEIAVVYISVPPQEVPLQSIISGLVLSLLFVFLYARNLSWLKD